MIQPITCDHFRCPKSSNDHGCTRRKIRRGGAITQLKDVYDETKITSITKIVQQTSSETVLVSFNDMQSY